MKKMKKALVVVLAFMLAFVMVVPAFATTVAVTPSAGDGSITIDNAVAGQTYKIYKIFDLERYYNGGNGTEAYYIYKMIEPFASDDDFVAAIAAYVNVDEYGYVSQKDGVTDNSAQAAAFAKYLLDYVQENNIQPTAKAENINDTTVVFTDLSLGYYLADSSLGALCALDTTHPTATLKEKNVETTIDKVIIEDNDEKEQNSANIGDTVEYQVKITVVKGADNYVLHDKMDPGLTFVPGSVKVYLGSVSDATEVGAANYSVISTAYNADTNPNGLKDDCTFEVRFTNTYLADLIADDAANGTTVDLLVRYEATVNEQAVINADNNGLSNQNKALLTFGDGNETDWDTVDTYVYKFDLVKTDNKNEVLDGAKFSLYREEKPESAEATQPDPIAFVKDGNTYRVATPAEIADTTIEKVTQIEVGIATIEGLAEGTYYLYEDEAPQGYNKKTEATEVKLGTITGSVTPTATANFEDDTNAVYTDGGVSVINNAGGLLPSTGGIGTAIFTIIGAVLAIAAVLFLVTKRKMSAEESLA